MINYDELAAKALYHFARLTMIPHGSENMERISAMCVLFAKQNNLEYVRDEANNVVIYKPASKGYEDREPIILQGHLDMVCQKEEDVDIDFETDGVEFCDHGDYISANKTTLGADNGVAVGMIMAILENDEIPHPPIEAVFTTDEEIGMIGASKLDGKLLKSKRMINLDAEEDDTLTVSCAGGSDFVIKIPVVRETKKGTVLELIISGLQGGHSGVDINKNRENASKLMGELLCELSNHIEYSLCEINGGDKCNAITNRCVAKVWVKDVNELLPLLFGLGNELVNQFKANEPKLDISFNNLGECEVEVMNEKSKDNVLTALKGMHSGVIKMSDDIEGLVETSLNLGILKTEKDYVKFHYALRSNTQWGLVELQNQFKAYSNERMFEYENFGHYPPWEFNKNSDLQKIFKECFAEYYGHQPKVEAIHAGLECGMFASKIEGLDCIAFGPKLYDVHTTKERFEKKSFKDTFALLLKILEKC